jgi:hypothetical protein
MVRTCGTEGKYPCIKHICSLPVEKYQRIGEDIFPAEAGNFSLHHRCVQNGSGAHPASYSKGTGDSFLGDKAARA